MKINKNKEMILIVILGCILVMSIGYSILNQALKIQGTASVGSLWSIKIINITSSPTGEATNEIDPDYTDTTATFKTNLVNPGDKMEYTITVKNEGTLDGIIENVNFEFEENDAITYKLNGIKRGMTIGENESISFTVTVEYNDVIKQPEKTSAGATVTVKAVQSHGSNITPVDEPISINDLKELAKPATNGLYEDEYEEGRYIYRGKSPYNYIDFNNETWRIISLESDGTLKIIKDESIGTKIWDERTNRDDTSTYYATTLGCHVWVANNNMVGKPETFKIYNINGNPETDNLLREGVVTNDSTMHNYLNNDYYENNIGSDKEHVVSGTFYIGSSGMWEDEEGLELDIKQEKLYSWNGFVGLLQASEYMRATTETGCNTLADASNGNCSENNWLNKGVKYWTITPMSHIYTSHVWNVNTDGSLNWSTYASRSNETLPVVFLTSTIKLTGTGNADDHFQIVKEKETDK